MRSDEGRHGRVRAEGSVLAVNRIQMTPGRHEDAGGVAAADHQPVIADVQHVAVRVASDDGRGGQVRSRLHLGVPHLRQAAQVHRVALHHLLPHGSGGSAGPEPGRDRSVVGAGEHVFELPLRAPHRSRDPGQ